MYLHVHLVVAAANGVVIATEKKLPSILVDETSVSIIFSDRHLLVLACCKCIGKLFLVYKHGCINYN